MSMSKVNKYLLPCALFASIALTACGEAPQQQQHALPVDIFTVEAKDIPLFIASYIPSSFSQSRS